MNASTFDTLSVARDLEAAGIERRHAEAHAEALRQAVSAGQLVSTDNASCTTITAIRISTAAPPLDSRPEMAHQRAHFPHQRRNLAPSPDRLATVAAMLPRMAVVGRTSAQLPAVHPASPVRHRGRLAWCPSPRPGTAPRGRVHGMDTHRNGHPLTTTAPGRRLAPIESGKKILIHGGFAWM